MAPVEEKHRKFKIVNNVLIGEEIPLVYDCLNVGEKILDSLQRSPNFVGQVDDFLKKQSTFREMRERSVKCALWLSKQGVKAGDVVGVCTHNHIDTYIPCLAALYIGAILNPWDDEMNISSARRFLTTLTPKVIFANESSARTIQEAAIAENLGYDVKIVVFGNVEGMTRISSILEDEELAARVDDFRCTKLTDPRHTALILYSSGTTGLPKATQISHVCVINQLRNNSMCSLNNSEVMLCFSPLYWIACPFLIIQSILDPALRIIYPEFGEEIVCKLIQKYKVSWMLLGVSMANRLISSGFLQRYELPSIKTLYIGGAKVYLETHEYLMKTFPQAAVLQGYGMTECAGCITSQEVGDKPGSCGTVTKNVQMKVIDVDTGATLGPNCTGEICAKSTCFMTGYYKNPEGNKQIFDTDGWLHSGDLGYWDEDGELFIVDRIKELIKFRGFHISPAEIEAVIQTHPAVSEVAVVSVPNPIDEEHPIAYVSKIPGAEVTEEELVRLVEENLHDHKRLRAGVQFLNEMPYTASGKMGRKELKQMAKKLVTV